VFVKIPSQLPDKFTVAPVVSLALKGLILDHEVVDLALGDFLQVADFLFCIVALVFELGLHNVQLTLDFVEVLTGTVYFLLFLVLFDSVSRFDVFLNFHAHDISINRQAHFIGHLIYFALLLLNSSPHVTQPRLQAQLKLFFGLHLLAESLLIMRTLGPHLLIVHLEVLVERVNLFFLCQRCLQVPLYSGQRPL